MSMFVLTPLILLLSRHIGRWLEYIPKQLSMRFSGVTWLLTWAMDEG